jgi:hypothetical protein
VGINTVVVISLAAIRLHNAFHQRVFCRSDCWLHSAYLDVVQGFLVVSFYAV